MLRSVFGGLAAMMILFPPPAPGDEMSSAEILQRLQAQREARRQEEIEGQGRTRTLSIVDDPARASGEAEPSSQDAVAVVRTNEESPAVAASVTTEPVTAATPPALDEDVAIDLEILFDFDSARLRPEARGQLSELCAAMAADDDSGVYQVIGHTDAAGSFDYNLTLSRARAAEVVRFLTGPDCRLPERRFIPVGLGEQRLKIPAAPRSAENRRVEIQIGG